jgi:hypothetical protein
MRVDIYGFALETPKVLVYLWSPWRSAALEHRLFDAVRSLPRMQVEQQADEVRVQITDTKTWRAVMQAVARVMKGWQEEADPGAEKRSWRWLLEADTDAHGYDHTAEQASIWAFLRVSLEHGGPEDGDKGEDIDLEGFGVQIFPANS